jgi:CheY-like chemotaxis protein
MSARVLVIDDQPSVGLLLRLVFDAMDVQVTATTSAWEGLWHLKQNAFDAIFVDASLPDMVDDEVIDRARAIRPEVPIVVMTAEPEHRTKSHTRADVVLHKPFRLAALEESLQVVCGPSEAAPATQ